MAKKNKQKNDFSIKDIISLFTVIFTGWFFTYFSLPVLNYGFVGWPFILILMGVVYILFDFTSDEYGDVEFKRTYRTSISLGLMSIGLIFFIILPIGTMPIFRAYDYQKLLGEVEEKTLSIDMSPTSPEDIIIIDEKTASKLADKKLVDENMSLGSQVEIGEFTLQQVNNKLYYVAPLNHSGFWKWRRNKEGTTGYMIVNANNDKDVRLITNINGEDVKLKYQEGAYVGDYLQRHIYKNGYKTKAFTDISFELDDNMMPWYVVTLYDKKVGYLGRDAIGTIIVNPKNGDIKEYSIEDTPEWVDRIQPSLFIISQVNDWGRYIHGAWNRSGRYKRQLSDGVQIVYGEDGKCYYYSSITSVGRDDASLGFVMVDTRTKKTILYKTSGAIEGAAQRSAEQRMPEKNYIASFPRPYNINGVWTYVMSLKDQEGLIKSIALVSYEKYQIVGVGDNIQDAIRNYRSVLNSSGNIIAPSSDIKIMDLTGTIERIGVDIRGSDSYYYFVIKEHPNKLFVSSSTISNKIIVTKVGDKVNISFPESSDGEIFIEDFENLNLNFDNSDAQVGIERKYQEVDDRIKNEQIDVRVKSKLENMTIEEKLKILNK